MAEKEYGNRRSDEELKRVTDELNALTYQLEIQPDFRGTEEQLKWMQALERYYIDGYPKVSDEEWDVLKHQFNYRESLVSIAPSGRQWVKMTAPLPSIDKIPDLQGVQDFCKKFEGQELIVEPKLDGLTANIGYKRMAGGDYRREYITSRGNGRYGLKLWEHSLDGVKLNGVPEVISGDDVARLLFAAGSLNVEPELFEIRGEAVLEKTQKNVKRYADPDLLENEQLEPGMEPVVWRSVVSGIFNRKVPANVEGIFQMMLGIGWQEYFDSAEQMDDDFVVSAKVDDIAVARALYSLMGSKHRFNKTSQLFVLADGSLVARHIDGHIDVVERVDEEVTVVSYSYGADGLNYDSALLADVPGIVHVSDVMMKNPDENGDVGAVKTKFFGEFEKPHDVMELVRKFYGCDENGKRDAKMPRYRNLHQFALDGLVLKLKHTSKESQGMDIRPWKGNLNKLVIPKYAEDQVACKLESEIVKVKLESIERTKTDLENVTCSGLLDKPYQTESGAFVTRINLHNPYWLQQNSWIQEGKEYRMVLAFDIIPTLLPPDDWQPDVLV